MALEEAVVRTDEELLFHIDKLRTNAKPLPVLEEGPCDGGFCAGCGDASALGGRKTGALTTTRTRLETADNLQTPTSSLLVQRVLNDIAVDVDEHGDIGQVVEESQLKDAVLPQL